MGAQQKGDCAKMTPEEMMAHMAATVTTLTQRLEQSLRLLEEERAQLKAERTEMEATMKLAQQFVARADEMIEHLSVTGGALTVVETRLRDSLTTLVSLNRSKAQLQGSQGHDGQS